MESRITREVYHKAKNQVKRTYEKKLIIRHGLSIKIGNCRVG